MPAILPQVIFAAAMGAAAAYLRSLPDDSRWDQDTRYNFTPFTALGVAISLFLGFRNNACYDRSVFSPISLPRSMAHVVRDARNAGDTPGRAHTHPRMHTRYPAGIPRHITLHRPRNDDAVGGGPGRVRLVC